VQNAFSLSHFLAFSSKEKYNLDFFFGSVVSSLLGTAPINPVSVSVKKKKKSQRDKQRKNHKHYVAGNTNFEF
jgi:hypothetical protein